MDKSFANNHLPALEEVTPIRWPDPEQGMTMLVELDSAHRTNTILRRLAHDLRNSVQVLALADPGTTDPSLDPRVAANVRTAIDRTFVILEIMSHLSHPADAEAAPLDSVLALDYVDELQTFLRERIQIPLIRRIGHDLPPLAIPDRRFQQILLAIITNAKEAQAERPGGMVVLTASGREGGLELIIEDEGPGIPQEILPLAFDAFASTKGPSHHGIGLTVARHLIERAGGWILLGNRTDGRNGARVVLWFPGWR